MFTIGGQGATQRDHREEQRTDEESGLGHWFSFLQQEQRR
jgi:hypothetical protein